MQVAQRYSQLVITVIQRQDDAIEILGETALGKKERKIRVERS